MFYLRLFMGSGGNIDGVEGVERDRNGARVLYSLPTA